MKERMTGEELLRIPETPVRRKGETEALREDILRLYKGVDGYLKIIGIPRRILRIGTWPISAQENDLQNKDGLPISYLEITDLVLHREGILNPGQRFIISVDIIGCRESPKHKYGLDRRGYLRQFIDEDPVIQAVLDLRGLAGFFQYLEEIEKGGKKGVFALNSMRLTEDHRPEPITYTMLSLLPGFFPPVNREKAFLMLIAEDVPAAEIDDALSGTPLDNSRDCFRSTSII